MELSDGHALMVGAGFHNQAHDFKTTHVTARRGGNDTVTIHDVKTNETLTGDGSRLEVAARNLKVDGFDTVRANSDTDEEVDTIFGTVDFLFEQFEDQI